MSRLPERRRQGRSMLAVLDDGLLVVVAVIGALIVLKLFGAIVATFWFMVKVAAVVALIFMIFRAIRSRAR